MSDSDITVTMGEIEQWFARHEGLASSAVKADAMVGDIVRHREPRWNNGDVVRDSHGQYWMWQSPWWRQFGSAEYFPASKPKRPLKKVS